MNMKKPKLEIHPSNRSEYVNKLVASRLLAAPIAGALDTDPDLRFLTLIVGRTSNISGVIYEADSKLTGQVNHFDIPVGLQGYGIGKRLFKAFVAECQDIGVTDLYSYSVSDQALLMRKSIFGEDGLQFYDDDHQAEGVLPVTLEQAFETNRRIDELNVVNPKREAPSGYIGVYLDLASLDTRGWERPHAAYFNVDAA